MRRALIAAVAAYALALVALALLQPTLGHDEAVYAVGARSLVEGGDASPYPVHRSIGMRLVATVPYALGGGDAAFRVAGLLGAAAFLLVLGGFLRPGGTAVLAVAAVATLPGVERRAYQLLTDLPSGALLLGALWCASRRRLAPAAALAAAAIYLRYGHVVTVAAYAIAWLAVVRPPRAWLAAAIGAALVAPLLVHGHARTGTITGMFVQSRSMVADVAPGMGVLDYAIQWFGALGGPIGGALAALGVGFAIAERRRRPTAPRRLRAALVLGSLLAIVGLGVAGHGEPRYVFVPFALLVAAGVHGAVLRGVRRRTLAIAVAASFAGATAYAAIVAHHDEKNLGVMRAAAEAIPGTPCRVLTGHGPVVEWYSGCRATPIPRRITADRAGAYLVTFDRGFRQPAVVYDGATCEPVATIPSRGGRIGGGAVCRIR